MDDGRRRMKRRTKGVKGGVEVDLEGARIGLQQNRRAKAGSRNGLAPKKDDHHLLLSTTTLVRDMYRDR